MSGGGCEVGRRCRSGWTVVVRYAGPQLDRWTTAGSAVPEAAMGVPLWERGPARIRVGRPVVGACLAGLAARPTGDNHSSGTGPDRWGPARRGAACFDCAARKRTSGSTDGGGVRLALNDAVPGDRGASYGVAPVVPDFEANVVELRGTALEAIEERLEDLDLVNCLG